MSTDSVLTKKDELDESGVSADKEEAEYSLLSPAHSEEMVDDDGVFGEVDYPRSRISNGSDDKPTSDDKPEEDELVSYSAEHILIGHDPNVKGMEDYVCSCGLQFDTRDEYKAHLDEVNQQVLDYTCYTCQCGLDYGKKDEAKRKLEGCPRCRELWDVGNNIAMPGTSSAVNDVNGTETGSSSKRKTRKPVKK